MEEGERNVRKTARKSRMDGWRLKSCGSEKKISVAIREQTQKTDREGWETHAEGQMETETENNERRKGRRD